MELQFAEYITSFKPYLYSQVRVDRLVAGLAAGSAAAVGRGPAC